MTRVGCWLNPDAVGVTNHPLHIPRLPDQVGLERSDRETHNSQGFEPYERLTRKD